MDLDRIIQQSEASCAATRHWTKTSQGKAIHRGMGSQSFIGTFRSAVSVSEDPTREKVLGIKYGVMAHSKVNNSAEGASLTYQIDEQGFQWTGISPLTADQLNNPSKDTDKREQAKEFLQKFLGPGPQLSNDVKQGAAAHGISPATLRRAEKDLGVTHDKGEGEGAAWYSELPPRRHHRGRLTPIREAEESSAEES